MTTATHPMFEIGEQARAEGRLKDAERAFQAVLADEPEDVDALHLLGVTRLMQGRSAHGAELLEQAADRAHDRADIRVNLGVALRAVGQLQRAANTLEEAIAIQPGEHNAYQVLGDVLFQTRDFARAGSFYRQALERNREAVGAWLGLGRVLYRQGSYRDAQKALAQAFELRPSNADILQEYGFALMQNAQLERARELFEQLEDQGNYRGTALLAGARIDLNLAQPERAQERLEALEKERSPFAQLLNLKAAAANMRGDRQTAINLYREALTFRDPASDQTWFELAQLAPEVISDTDLATMEKLAERLDAPQQKARLHFARAAVWEYREQWGAQFQALQTANSLRRSITPYDRDEAEATDATCRRAFSADFFRRARARAPADSGLKPIFILGMPRSGTTLTEQILSAHSRVRATGENRALNVALNRVGEDLGDTAAENLFAHVAEGGMNDLIRYFREYLREQHSFESGIFTDKSLLNYRFLPLLAAAFPEARFIELSRDSMELCFGCYKQLFAYGQHFSYDLGGCAHALASFNRLMEHWHRELPELPIFRLSYEDLVRDQEGQTRALLEFCGLEWEEACLDFHKNQRAVATASQNQVRAGLTSRGMNRVERYGDLLDPLREALRAEGVEV